jgi:hypothetical protein
VAIVLGVLLHHVHQHSAQHHRPAPRIVARPSQVSRPGHEPVAGRDLSLPHLPCLRHNSRVGDRAIEVSVGIGIRAEVRRRTLPSHASPEPSTLHLGHMAHQPQQRQRRRPQRATGQVHGAQAGTLQFQRARRQRRNSASMARSPPTAAHSCRGSFSEATNISALLCVLSIPAIIGTICEIGRRFRLVQRRGPASSSTLPSTRTWRTTVRRCAQQELGCPFTGRRGPCLGEASLAGW